MLTYVLNMSVQCYLSHLTLQLILTPQENLCLDIIGNLLYCQLKLLELIPTGSAKHINKRNFSLERNAAWKRCESVGTLLSLVFNFYMRLDTYFCILNNYSWIVIIIIMKASKSGAVV